MKILRTSLSGGLLYTSIYTSDNEEAIMVNVDCASTVQAGSPSITPATYLTIAVCKWVDSSNFCVQLDSPPPAQYGNIIEVHADGGSITVFPQSGTFFDGSSSVSTSTCARFRYVIGDSTVGWSKVD